MVIGKIVLLSKVVRWNEDEKEVKLLVVLLCLFHLGLLGDFIDKFVQLSQSIDQIY